MNRRSVIYLGGYYRQHNGGWGQIECADSYTEAQYREFLKCAPGATWFTLIDDMAEQPTLPWR